VVAFVDFVVLVVVFVGCVGLLGRVCDHGAGGGWGDIRAVFVFFALGCVVLFLSLFLVVLGGLGTFWGLDGGLEFRFPCCLGWWWSWEFCGCSGVFGWFVDVVVRVFGLGFVGVFVGGCGNGIGFGGGWGWC